MRLIACSSLQPELEMLAAARSPPPTLQFLEMGLHQRSSQALHQALQDAIDSAGEADAIAIGYGLCNRGIIGLEARGAPLVIPRAHDCIGLLLGSSQRYAQEMEREPGTYFQSVGWLKAARQVRQPDFTFALHPEFRRDQLVARYGEEAASYLVDQISAFTRHYRRLAYIATNADTGDGEAVAVAKAQAWDYARLDGDLGWLTRLLAGPWDDGEFLTVQPGERVAASHDERLIRAEKI